MATETISRIRQLLDELEVTAAVDRPTPDIKYLGTEIQSLVTDVVDFLQPLMTPYASAFYWYLLRHSLFQNGDPYIRVSTRKLQTGVVKSARSEKVSQSQIKELLFQLEESGAIRKEGEPNRLGTLYRVLTLAEIESSCQLREAKAVPDTFAVDSAEIDFIMCGQIA